MVRSLVFLLLLIVVFFIGMLTGIDREQNTVIHDSPTETKTSTTVSDNLDREKGEIEQTAGVIGMEVPEKSTQKMASFLETGVKGFYEILVEVLYKVSSLFV